MEHSGAAPSRRFVHARVLSRRTADAVLLLTLDDETAPVALDGPGVEIWDLLATPRSITEVIDALRPTFGLAAGDISDSVGAYVEQLHAAGLVEDAVHTS
jgi:hypothetical protein